MTLNSQENSGVTMDCRRIEAEGTIERYLNGRLSDQEETAFEQHYLGCARCFSDLQMQHAAALELNRRPLVIQPPKLRFASYRQWGLAAAAVVLISIAALLFYRNQQKEFRITSEQQRAIQDDQALIDQLAMVEQPPPYLPSTMRGGVGDRALEEFQSGMVQYRQGNYANAIPILTGASHFDADHQPTVFYLGICYLMTGKPDDCIRELSKLVAEASGPYQEESHWYLAKSYLKKKDLTAAQRELQATVTLNGPHASDARAALQTLQKVSHGKLR